MSLVKALTKVDPEFEEALLTFQKQVEEPLGKDPDTDLKYLNAVVWELGVHWLIRKKWAARHRIPGHRTLVKQIEPYGELLFREFELCIQIHAIQTHSPYKNAADWFVAIQSNSQLIQGHLNKTELSQFHRKISGCMRSHENPFDEANLRIAIPDRFPLPPAHSYQAISQLITASLKLAYQLDRGNNFRSDYWKPYLNAYSKWIKTVSSPGWSVLQIEAGKLRKSSGSGKGMIPFLVNKSLVAEALQNPRLLSS